MKLIVRCQRANHRLVLSSRTVTIRFKLKDATTHARERSALTIREPAVAGTFYPADEEHLQREVDELLHFAVTKTYHIPKAMIVPHAGYNYSGTIAAEAYRLLLPARHIIKRVTIIGPAHRCQLNGMAIPRVDAFTTPLGEVPIDHETMSRVSKLPNMKLSDKPHQSEHCLEVQLPFLQTTLDDFEILPIIVGDCDSDVVARVIDTVWDDDSLLVVSSDLSHYLSHDEAREFDAKTGALILSKSATLTSDKACGCAAINGLLKSKRCQTLTIKIIDLRNSGDIIGKEDEVVGYGAFVLY